MNRRMLIGSLFAVFLLILLPSIPAIECNTIVESNKSYFLEKIQSVDIEELKNSGWSPGYFLAIIWWILFLIYIELDPGIDAKYPLFLLSLMILWFILFILSSLF